MAYIYDSHEYTGNPATFTDTHGTSDISSLSVPFSPIQDLHGYDSPWIGTDYDQQPYNFRAVSSSSVSPLGNSEMGNIVGGTVAWNQLAPTINGINYIVSPSYCAGEYTDGKVAVTMIAVNNEAYYRIKASTPSIIAGHKYLFSEIVNSPRNSVLIYLLQGGKNHYNSHYDVLPNTKTRLSAIFSAAYSTTGAFSVYFGGASFDVGDIITFESIMLIDLTAMFGSAIADYIYSLETGTAGAGVAKLKSWGFCTKPYYAYDAGSLLSVNTSAHRTVGFNQWDEVWERGTIGMSTGQNIDSNDKIRSKNYVPIFPNTTYYFKMPNNWRMCYYDANKNLLNNGNTYDPNRTLTSPDGAYYLRFVVDGTTAYANNVCINLSKTSGTPKNGDYAAYAANTYALDSSLTLRGIPKLDANNNLYYDGDVYESSGTVTRKYGIVDLGTLSWDKNSTYNYFYATVSGIVRSTTWTTVPQNIRCPLYTPDTANNVAVAVNDKRISVAPNADRVSIYDSTYAGSTKDQFKTAMNGVYFLYELATPTTETATAYAATQSIDPDGTEEYVDYAESQGTRDVAIPVGHYTNYANICPISGRTGLSVYVGPTQDQQDATTYAVDWTDEAGTVYGGTDEVVGGVLTDEWAEISSYNGETITEPWLSSMDEYAPGATPTTGAQVVYKLATPITYQLTAQEVAVIKNSVNNVWADTGNSVTVTVFDMLYGFQGWLIKVGSGMTLIPTEMIQAETYKASPNQRMEESAERDVSGYLWRNTVANQPPKIEFETPPCYNADVKNLNDILKAAYSVPSERKLPVAYYDNEEDCYKTADCYIPNIDFPIRTIDIENKVIFYDPIRYAFIGY